MGWVFIGMAVLFFLVAPSAIVVATACMRSSQMSQARRDLGLEADEG